VSDTNETAYPSGNVFGFISDGRLTKREAFAMAAMQGHAANAAFEAASKQQICRWSVEMADALIEALNKKGCES
jgi:hypothetical protein